MGYGNDDGDSVGYGNGNGDGVGYGNGDGDGVMLWMRRLRLSGGGGNDGPTLR